MRKSLFSVPANDETAESTNNGIIRNFIGLSRTEHADKYLQKLQREREENDGKYKQELDKLPMRINQLHTEGHTKKKSRSRKWRENKRPKDRILWKDSYDIGEIGILVKRSLDGVSPKCPETSIQQRVLNVTSSLFNIEQYNALHLRQKEPKQIRSLGSVSRKKHNISISSTNSVKARKFIPNQCYNKVNGDQFISNGNILQIPEEAYQVINLGDLKKRRECDIHPQKSHNFLKSQSLSERSLNYKQIADWSNGNSTMKLGPDFHTTRLRLPVFLPPLSMRLRDSEAYDSQLGFINTVKNSNRATGLKSASSTQSSSTKGSSFIRGYSKVLEKSSSKAREKSTPTVLEKSPYKALEKSPSNVLEKLPSKALEKPPFQVLEKQLKDYAQGCVNKPQSPLSQRNSPKCYPINVSKESSVVSPSSKESSEVLASSKESSVVSASVELESSHSYMSDYSYGSHFHDIKVEIKRKCVDKRPDTPSIKSDGTEMNEERFSAGNRDQKTYVPFRQLSIEFKP